MEQKFLNVSEFYQIIDKIKDNKQELNKFLSNLKKNYIIPEANKIPISNCNSHYSEEYIVYDSKKRFKSEIENSHYMSHFHDLCKYPEIMGTLRFMYNLINLRKDDLINLLYGILSVLPNHIGIFGKHFQYYDIISDFFGLQNQIDRIKIISDSPITNFKIYESSEVKYSRKMTVNLMLIINLSQDYPRNLITCPINKVVLAERNKNNNGGYYFVCHKNNMIDRLKTNKLCLSVWLIKNLNKTTNKWETSIKMGTAYLTDTFPGENGNVNDFINDVKSNGITPNSTMFLNKINDNIKNFYYNAIEVYEPFFDTLTTDLNDNKSNLSVRSNSSFKFSKKFKKWKSKNKNSKIKKLLNSNNFF